MKSSHFQKCSVHETSSAPISVNRNFMMHSKEWHSDFWNHDIKVHSYFNALRRKKTTETPSLSCWLQVMHSHICACLYIYAHFRNARSQQCKNWGGCEFKLINNSYADSIWKHVKDNNSDPQWRNNFNTYFLRFEWIELSLLNWMNKLNLFLLSLKKEKKKAR